MAFGKRKTREDEAPLAAASEPAGAPAELAADAPAGEAIGSELFAADATATDTATPPQPELIGAEDAPEAAPPTEPAPASGDPLGGGPDLMSMFQTTTIESDDKAALLELAGEVEMDDLLEDLHTIASAIATKR